MIDKSKFMFKTILKPISFIFSGFCYLILINMITNFFEWHDYEMTKVVSENEVVSALDNHFKKMEELFHWRGAVSISFKGKRYDFSYRKEYWNENTESLIASISKSVTSQALFQLSKKNKINLMDSVCKYISEPCDLKEVKIYNILNHTSGLEDSKNIVTQLFLEISRSVMTKSPTETVNMYSPMKGDPNKKFKYYNFNFILASKIIENITGKKLNDALNDLVFKPAGMENSYVFDKNGSRLPVRPGCVFVTPVYWSLKCPQNKLAFGSFSGAGGVVSTTDDLLKFASFTVSSGILDQHNKYSTNSLSKKFEYALGLVKRKPGYYMHNGSTLGYRSELAIWPEKELYISVLSNSHASPNISSYINDIYKIIVGSEYRRPVKNNWFPKLK